MFNIIETFKDDSPNFNELVIKLIVIGFPSQDTWNYQKDQAILNLSKKYGFTYINLNNYDLNIDWESDTKDKGGHLNYYGALKASKFVGNILKDTNLLVDKKITYK